jgi:hypothetical protein
MLFWGVIRNYSTWLLDTVGHVDELRGQLGDGEYSQPPEIRTDLLKLHGLAMDVVNNGWHSQLGEWLVFSNPSTLCA